ncbi:hypothetical protein [Nocardioides sp.]|uniref:hypothetical protein n=1 Tax=Nocardioides sp. TaxID=35761 RepID=UPI002C98065E|nr:hypothetical protein [Nocardioides sp.]HXH79464.1 hypothetical protein [Nocardioides sp.]
MPYVVLGLFLLVVVAASWHAARRGQGGQGCCAPADPRADLRMRGAFEDETGGDN